jgi:hypothetical protein
VRIVDVFVTRSPVQSAIQHIINAVSISQNHDVFFHLGIIIRLANNEIWLLEKNEEVNLVRYRGKQYSETRGCPKPRADATLGLFISNGIARFGIERIMHYRATSTNCQQFGVDMLQANGILTPDLQSWIMQDVSSLLPAWATALTNGVTDLAAHMKYVVEGEGKGEGAAPTTSS